MIVETNPYKHMHDAGAENKTLEAATLYITDDQGTRWQLKCVAEGLSIRTTTGSALVVFPDCANTIIVRDRDQG